MSIFIRKKAFSKAKCKVLSRGKEDDIYIMQLKLISEMKSFSADSFIDFPCNIEAIIRIFK